jgi:L-lysine 6-transaminase
MCAFDLPDHKKREMLIQKSYENCLLILPCGSKSVRFRPPLNVSREEIDRGLDIIIKTIEEHIL